MDFSLLLSLGGEDFFAGHYWSGIGLTLPLFRDDLCPNIWIGRSRGVKRGLYVKNWINIRPKSGVILVADLPKVDADTQWGTIDILWWRRKVSLASTVCHYN